jgi:hypothetical protein
VLIPGAGLSRLMVEVAALGLEAQGNEFSYYMLLGGSFMLNHAVCRDQWTLHPWLHSNLNHVSNEDQARCSCSRAVLCAYGYVGTCTPVRLRVRVRACLSCKRVCVNLAWV